MKEPCCFVKLQEDWYHSFLGLFLKECQYFQAIKKGNV